jgi:DNA polymerase-4
VRAEPSVLHLDADAFFAAVEQRQKPSLRGRPVIVAGLGDRGVVATASYEARTFGVGSAMPTRRARALCPGGLVLAPRFEAYTAHSAVILAALRELSPLVEPISLDEAYVDLAAGDYAADPVRAADQVRRVIYNRCGLVVSVGLGRSKLIAKLASDADKPNGFTVVGADAEDSFLLPLAVTRLWGVGAASAEALRTVGVTTIAELREQRLEDLVQLLGRAHGGSLYNLARGHDERGVNPDRVAKSVGAERTFAQDISGQTAQQTALDGVLSAARERLLRHGGAARTVTVKVRFADFTTLTRAASLAHATADPRLLRACAQTALHLADTAGAAVRLLGVSFSGLSDSEQLTLDLPNLADTRGGASPRRPTSPGGAAGNEDADSSFSAADSGDAESSNEAVQVLPAPLTATTAWPGVDVDHPEYGAGWVYAVGAPAQSMVTVRFEGPGTGPGRDRTFDLSRAALRLVMPPQPQPPRKLAALR